jgi:hypothetical protein
MGAMNRLFGAAMDGRDGDDRSAGWRSAKPLYRFLTLMREHAPVAKATQRKGL